MEFLQNLQLPGKHQKPILTDVVYKKNGQKKPVVIFCHGYKGFKDWGAFPIMAPLFAKEHIVFVKFNFSHNGGTPQQPIDFPDLEAFGHNNYLKELDDLQSVIDWVINSEQLKGEIDSSNLSLIGHSRGGGIVLLKASEEPRISKVITWAGVSDFASRFVQGEALKQWEKEGVMYVENARTRQQMPHYFQFYTSFWDHSHRLSIQRAVQHLTIPQLIIHGDADTSVAPMEATRLHEWNPKSEIFWVPNADHVFGAKQPWPQTTLPTDLSIVIRTSIQFIYSQNTL